MVKSTTICRPTMKSIAILAVLFLAGASARLFHEVDLEDVELSTELMRNGVTRAGLADIVQKKAEELRNIILHGDAEKGIPILDPFVFNQTNVHIQLNKTFTLDAILDAGSAVGLGSFNITEVKVGVLPIHFKIGIELPSISALGKYSVDGVFLNLIPLYGNGDLNVGADRLYGFIDVLLSSSNGTVYVKNLDIDFAVFCLHLNTTGFVGGDLGDVVQDIAEENFPELVERFKLAYQDKVISFLTVKVNKWLEGKTIDDIIKIIQG